ncbi:MAG: IS3 family transposase [Dehalococcoidales bacterium]|nr:IS3 family transposase [Dehalococcoidales bacterium]
MGRSGYYKWLNRKPTPSEKRLRKLMGLILQVYEEHRGIYGYRRITIYLNHFLGAKVNHKLVYRLMKLAGLKAVIRRKRYAYKPHKPAHVAENILNREFRKAYQPMTVLLTDVTEFKYGQQSKAYLSAILDYGENKIVAYQLSKANNNALVRDTVSQIKDQLIPSKTLLHSDRGFQYTSHGFKKFVAENRLIQSMSRVGKCIDNGPMENFWGIIIEEMYRLKTYQSFEELKQDIKQYIAFYNTRRVTLKMGLGIPA